MYINKAIIYGNLTAKPELKALPSGQKTTSFSLATNRPYTDKDGNKRDEASFHNVVAYGKQAETICQYMDKGKALMVEGRLTTRSWEQEGKKHYKTEIILENFQFGQKKEEEIPF
jgi:single-strand DNA-binding protein